MVAANIVPFIKYYDFDTKVKIYRYFRKGQQNRIPPPFHDEYKYPLK